jgi:cyclopropane fatty-acyl-phospholipid synthase-like methyltransferase
LKDANLLPPWQVLGAKEGHMLECLLAAAFGYAGIITACDVADYRFDVPNPLCSQTTRTSKCYDWFEQYLEKNYDRNKDYSEGVFGTSDEYVESEYTKTSLEEATERKYEYIFKKLDLKAGMKLLDAGCGTGKWMQYCRDRGVEVVGLTLSEEQAKVVRAKGLEVRVQDYRIKDADFIDSFDRITALGSSEHVCSSQGGLKGDLAAKRCNQTRIETWKLFYDYLKSSGKFYVTVLTINVKRKFSAKDWAQTYILERHYGGYYSNLEDLVEKVIPNTGFTLTDLQDKTRDYHWSSIIDKDHFGHWNIKWNEDTANKISYLFKGLVTDPYLLHHWIYYFGDTWMWQFGGYQDSPLTDEQVMNAPAHLKYFMLEKN